MRKAAIIFILLFSAAVLHAQQIQVSGIVTDDQGETVPLEENKVDMLITDIALHGISGVELCKKVSGNFSLSHIPIIVLSAISSVDTKIRCIENGALLYIEKPFSMDYLEACIRGIFDKRTQLKADYRSGRNGKAKRCFKKSLAERNDNLWANYYLGILK